MKTKQDKLSYAVGLKAGVDLKRQFHDLNGEFFKQGFLDALDARSPALSDKDIKESLQEFQNQRVTKEKILFEHLAKTHKQEGEKFLEENKAKTGVKVFPSGLQYKVLKLGMGKGPSRNDVVTIHYEGSLLNGHVFDSTYAKKKPVKFVAHQTIPGLAEVIKEMRVGDEWEVYIPWYLAYGENGYGQHIPPNATLVFKVELVKIN